MAVGAAALFVAGTMQGCTGFGMAMAATPVLLLVSPPAMVVPAVILLSTLNTLWLVAENWRLVRPRLVGPLALGGFLGFPAGLALLTRAHPDLLRGGTGLIVVIFAVAILRGWRRPLGQSAPVLVPVGIAGGALGAATSIGGPPVILFLASQNLPKHAFRANIAAYFLIVNVYGMVIFALQGVYTAPLLGRLALLAPAMLLGTYVGARTVHRMPQAAFVRISMSAVGAMGLLLIARSLLNLV